MDNTEKFTGKAALYNKARLSYAKEFVDYLYGKIGFNSDCTVADIGSGTGIFTKHLLEKGSRVLAVEPNDDMRRYTKINLSHYTNLHTIKGTAENTTLEDESVDFITVAQAFHWFDMLNFRKECSRILKPKGKVILIWNSKIKTS